MLRRWIIRGLGIALLTLCAATWVGSYFETLQVLYWSDTHDWWSSLGGGELFLNDKYHGPFGDRGWNVSHQQYDANSPVRTRMGYEKTLCHLLGFGWHPQTSPKDQRYLMIPLWFPTTLSAGLLCLVWRKTRPQYTGKSFPVEVGGKEDKVATKP